MAKPVTIRILGDASGLNKALGSAGGTLGKFAKNAAFASAAVAGAVGAGLFKLGQESEKMTAAIVQGTGAVGEQLAALESSALQVMGNVPDAGETVATALADVNTRLGLTGDELEALTETSLDFARLTGQDVTEAVNGVADVMGVWSMEAGEAEEVMGDLLRISQASGVPVDELTAALSKQGGTLSALGLNAEEATEFLADLGKAGVPIRKAGAGVEYFTDQMLAAGKDPRAEWEKLQEEIQGATSDLEAQRIATEALGPAGLAMVGPMREGQLELGDLAADSTGVIQAQISASATLGEKFAEVSNKMKSALIPVANVLMDKLAVALSVVTDYVLENFPKWRDAIMPVVDAVTDGVRMFADVLKGGAGDDSFISKFAEYLRDIVWPLIVDVKDWIVDNWPTISAVFSAVFGFIVEEVLPRVIEAIRFVAEVIGVVVGYIVEHWPEISAVIQTVIDFVVDEVLPRIVSAFEWIQEAVQVFIDAFQRFWSAWGDTITESLTKAWDAIKGIVSGALDYLKGVFDFWKALFTGDWGAMWDAIVDQVSGLWTLLKGAFLLGWEAVKLSFKMVWESIKIMASAAFGKIVDGIKALPGLMWEGLKAGGQLLLDAGSWMGDKIMEGLVAALKFVGQTLWDMLPGPVQWGLEHGASAVGGVVDFFNPFGGGDDEPEYTMADFGNPDSPAYTMMGGGGYDYSPQARGGGTNNITVNTSMNATPSEITDAVVWGLQVSGVN